MSELKRVVGLPGAVLLGLGSILGTGVFVSIGIAAGTAGDAITLAVLIGGLVACFNGLSSAQLAAAHPVSGGTYEYGYKYLNPYLGFTAGWMFLLAKSASAATAALGFSHYVLPALGMPSDLGIAMALVAVVILTILVGGGITRSNQLNTAIVLVTIVSLLYFVYAGLDSLVINDDTTIVLTSESTGLRGLLHASALMFVAYTGYGRIATMGEEIKNPGEYIPKAILWTLGVSVALYVMVASVLELVRGLHGVEVGSGLPINHWLISLGAITAMLGVLLNLILGLSRVLLAMGRRGDFPQCFAKVREEGATPVRAVYMMGAVIGGLVLIGDVKTTWTFSAFTVLIYYSITNLAALKLPKEQVLYPRFISVLGLASCLFLAFWVDAKTWLIGLGLIGLGLVWKKLRSGTVKA